MTTSADIQYPVIRRFKYNGVFLEKGDQFTPGEGPHDRLIVEQGKLVNNKMPVTPRETAAKERRYNGVMNKARGVKLPSGIAAILTEAGIDPTGTAALSDADLKDIKGIGPAAVVKIRSLEAK